MSAGATTSKSLWPFTPQSIPGCQLWLDGADSTTVTGTTSVSSWADKSGQGHNATTSGNYPSYANNTMTFSGSSTMLYMSIPYNYTTAGGTIVFVGKPLPNTGNWRTLLRGANSDHYVILNLNTTQIGCYGQGVAFQQFGTYTNDGTKLMLMSVNISTSSLFSASMNGDIALSAVASPTTDTADSYYVLGNYQGGGQPWGDINEIIIYNSALTTSQRQQVEGYLASKWGLQSNLPATHPYYSSPLTVGNLVLWVDCADTTSYTLGNVTGLGAANKGTAGGRMSPPTGNGVVSLGSTLNGVQAWTVQAAAVMAMPSLTFATTSRTVFLVVNIGASGSLYQYINGTTSGTDLMCYSYTNGDLELNTPGTNRLITNTPTSYFSTSSIVAITSGIYIDGTSQTLAVNNGNSFNSGVTTTTMTLGASGSALFKLGEMMIFDGLLTAAQRQTVETYLSQKWGIALSYSGAVSVISRPLFQRTFQPTDITGCQLWLDAADQQSITLSGSNVSQWSDKSGNGNNGTATGTPVLTANSINGRQSIYLADAPYFLGSVSITGTTLTCFTVATTNVTMLNTRGRDQRLVSLENGTNVDYGRADGTIALFNQNNTSTIATYRVSGPLANNAITTGSPFLAVSQYDGTNAYLWYAGTAGTLASTASTGTFAITKYGIGNQANPTAETWNGYIGEVIIYNAALTTSQRQQVEGYLAWKWGLISSLASGHPGKILPSFSSTFTPKSISGMSLWLDAADQQSITLSGSNVSQWNDKSGNGSNATATGTVGGITKSSAGVVFSGGASWMTIPGIATKLTNTPFVIIVVETFTGNFASKSWFFGDDANTTVTDSTLTLGYRQGSGAANGHNGAYSMSFWADDLDDLNFTQLSPTGVTRLWSNYLPTATNRNIRLNGAVDATHTNFTRLNAFATPVLGRANGLGYYYGTISEIIVYNQDIGLSQIQQVEGYLAWKWGLQNNLPSTHAFKKFKP